MPIINDIAQRIADENGYTIDSDIEVADLEYLIDMATDFINLEAGTSIADIAANNLTATNNEFVSIKLLGGLMLRAYLAKGPTASVQGMSVVQISTDPHYKVFMKLFNMSLKRLRGRSIERV